MEYIEMTIEEALEYNKGNKAQVVLVAVKDLEKNEGITEFIRKSVYNNYITKVTRIKIYLYLLLT